MIELWGVPVGVVLIVLPTPFIRWAGESHSGRTVSRPIVTAAGSVFNDSIRSPRFAFFAAIACPIALNSRSREV